MAPSNRLPAQKTIFQRTGLLRGAVPYGINKNHGEITRLSGGGRCGHQEPAERGQRQVKFLHPVVCYPWLYVLLVSKARRIAGL
jgi:hypothetical protein